MNSSLFRLQFLSGFVHFLFFSTKFYSRIDLYEFSKLGQCMVFCKVREKKGLQIAWSQRLECFVLSNQCPRIPSLVRLVITARSNTAVFQYDRYIHKVVYTYIPEAFRTKFMKNVPYCSLKCSLPHSLCYKSWGVFNEGTAIALFCSSDWREYPLCSEPSKLIGDVM